MESQTLTIILIGTALLLLGIAYAYYIALRPFPPRLTWLSVVIGDAVTDIGMVTMLYVLTNNIYLASIPVLCHILTGAPMILGQMLKHDFIANYAEDLNEVIKKNDANNEVIKQNNDDKT